MRACFPSDVFLMPLFFLLAGLFLGAGAAHAEPGRAGDIFASLRAAVAQVRVIDTASGDKAAIGSGFQVAADGLIATNFHVVSEAAYEPGRYRLEYLSGTGTAVPLQLIDVDVVHDLALLRAATPLAAVVPLAQEPLSHGERIFSMGNPLDLAMTIIEGTYNGFVEGARYRKILFSGSLNPGMSGGPALNEQGELVGINVARGGEQISFLVPGDYLAALRERALDPARVPSDIGDRIAAALLADQDAYFGALLQASWSSQPLGNFRIPGRISPTVQCWGGSDETGEERYRHVGQECGSEDTVFVQESLETGSLRYAFNTYASDELNGVQFYALLDGQYAHNPWFSASDESQAGNFECREDFLKGKSLDWRISVCARRYKDLEGLFDMSVVMASTGFAGEGLIANLGINGISEPRARQFLRRFVESISWAP